MTLAETKIAHPDFAQIHEVGAGGFPVIVFARDEYDDDVPEFTRADCESIRQAVIVALPDYFIRETWNGRGLKTFSVSIKPRD